MRWFVTLSTAVLVSLTASAYADQSKTVPQSSTVRTQPQAAVTQTPSVRTQTVAPVQQHGTRYPQVVTVRPDEAAAKPAPVAEAPTAVPAQPVPDQHVHQPVQQPVRYAPAQRQSPGLFGQIMELERRKNAWLRGLFR